MKIDPLGSLKPVVGEMIAIARGIREDLKVLGEIHSELKSVRESIEAQNILLAKIVINGSQHEQS